MVFNTSKELGERVAVEMKQRIDMMMYSGGDSVSIKKASKLARTYSVNTHVMMFCFSISNYKQILR